MFSPLRSAARILARIALLPLAAPAVAAAQAPRPHYAPIIAEFRDSIPKLLASADIPGLAIAVVDEHSVVWAEGFGYTDTNRTTAVTPGTLFSIQSMSKSFTAAAVLVAVQEGLVDLDTPIVAYLPEFTVNSRFEEHPERKITLRLLLSHHAGFTHEAPVGNNYDGDAESFEEHVASISRTWLRFPVGQRYSYSNLGIDLAGFILQVRSGVPFERYVKDELLEPLGMASSTFDQREIVRLSNRAIGHRSSPGPIPVAVPMIPAGGLYSSVDDLSRFVQLQLNGGLWQGEQVIETRLLDQMKAIHDPNARQSVGYGLGVASGLHLGARHLNHGGGGFGFLSHMRWYPQFGLGIVLLTSSGAHPFQNSLPEGSYRCRAFGRVAGTIEVTTRHGHLFLDHMRLAEYEPGLFFTPHGEALDVRGAEPTWRNIRLERAVGEGDGSPRR